MTNNETPDTINQPYPTIEDKVKLFQEHGIDAGDYHRGKGNRTNTVRFTGDQTIVDRVIKISADHSIRMIALHYAQDYDGVRIVGFPYWLAVFSCRP